MIQSIPSFEAKCEKRSAELTTNQEQRTRNFFLSYLLPCSIASQMAGKIWRFLDTTPGAE